MKRRDFARGLVATPFLPALAAAQATWNPDRPIRFVVGFAPGGATDSVARVVADGISPLLGQPVVVENRVGASGNIGSEYVARSAPDGYTFVVGSAGTHATNQFLFRNMGFHVVRDFSPIALVTAGGALLAVHPSVPVRNLNEFIAYAKANPGKLNMGTAGPGSTQHFAGALFEQQAGVQFTHIPYRGGAPAMQDLIAGQLQVLFAPLAESLTFARSEQIRPLATTRTERMSSLPDIPAIAEAVPGYRFNSWNGVFGPAGLPQPIVQRMTAAITAAGRDARTRGRLENLGYTSVSGDAAAMAEMQRQDVIQMEELVRLTGASGD
ncbi:Bug family tripartite tricarboxylate transporter substrate binding protein [Roseococcus pinisoli]|uniref:Tripartite tricarboxylate transporter substrate binding protein n=1 Tax=Roseococcus pinisoli TaxID=2835040 RepID=A0ABS5Q809_9PROT|nr:tripartite tricarboxylate transporter substrate binding protein [Roseococcus pinisoli]MBS7809776.1 tripartite tricarboxylate transporter substrate binding protein [Roseococcus pinisoli]